MKKTFSPAALGGSRQKWFTIGAAVLVYAALFLLHVGIKPYADDLWYMERAAGWDSFWALQWNYYLTWSGRVVASALAFFLFENCFWLWQVLNPLFIMALAVGMARVVSPKPTAKSSFLALLLLFLFGPGVLDYAVFWATGSLYYLWAVAWALFLLHPFFDLALRGQTEMRFFAGRVVLAVLACLCNEQVTACVLGFMVVCLGAHLWKARSAKPLWRHFVLLGVAAVCALVLFLAPGSDERYLAESYQYYLEHYTGFYEVPLWEKITNGITWSAGMLTECLYLVLVLLFGLCWQRRYKEGRGRLRLPLFGLGVLAVAFAFPAQVDGLFAFANFGELFAGQSAAGIFVGLVPYLFWGVFLLALLYMLWRENVLHAIALLAALATLAVMFFSPTIYVSGYRTLFAAGVILATLCLGLYEKSEWGHLPLVLTGSLAAVNIARLASRLTLFH